MAPLPASTIAPQPGILDIAPYQGGASKLAGHKDVLKLSSNENPLGCSPHARAALLAAAGELHRYPSSGHQELRQAIGEVHGLEPARLICGNGSDEILNWLCQAYAGPGLEVLYPRHGFSMYRIGALAAGARPVDVPEAARHVDIDAMIDAATAQTRVIFIANPANPTGTMVALDDLERLARAVPQALLVLDGAYSEYAEGYDGGAALVSRLPNVVMTRTFSKIYGLGGLRVGWAYAPADVIDVLNRVRGPFNISGPALAAAEAAVRDQEWVARSRRDNSRLRETLRQGLDGIGIPSDPSHANFVLAHFKDAQTAEAADLALRADGIIVRRVAGYHLPEALRITVGDEAACARVIASLTSFMGANA